MAEEPLPAFPDPDQDAEPPRWWGGCLGCLLVLLSGAVTVTGAALLLRAAARLWR